MVIRCWGARGSLPVSGAEYVRYGGSTACVEVRAKSGEVLVVDAGTGIRKLGNRLLSEGLHDYHMLITHAHWDHIMGFPFFLPIYMEGTHIRLSGCTSAQKSMHEILRKTMASPNFPVDFSMIKSSIDYLGACPTVQQIGSVEVRSIPLSHPNGGLGFKFIEDGKSFVFLTDNELHHNHHGSRPYEEYLKFAEGADLLIHDAEYRPEEYGRTRGWGHSVYTDALRFAMEAGARRFWLYHHNVERDDDDLEEMLLHCRKEIRAAKSALHCEAAMETSELVLE